MRAHWQPQLTVQDSYTLTGDAYHHLVKVVRVKVGEQLLLLNGSGLVIKTQIDLINKREVHLSHMSSKIEEHPYRLNLALGMPKKEALELCLKQAVELGFQRIFLVASAYSQRREPELERLQRILVAALEQSNAPFLPEVIYADWDEIPWSNFGQSVFLNSQKVSATRELAIAPGEQLLIVGPEGGFSPEETTYISSRPGVLNIWLPTPILRTPTAVAAGAGLMLCSLLD
jgi:16S rRNA (uracil1498-N3)-methyltransferase